MSQVFYPTTNLAATEQLIIERGEGVYVYDNHGRQYLEGLAGLWCAALGYGNEELIAAASEQMKKLSYTHMFGGKSHQVGMDLADRLAEMVPVHNARVFFGNSGSDANDTLVKMIRYYFDVIGKPGKTKIIARERAYHGVTLAAACLTGLYPNHAHFNLPMEALGILRTEAPHFYRQGLPGETEEAFATRLADSLEQLILREDPETIAAMIVEPVNGAGGVVVPPATYFEKIQAVLDRYDILMWDDEVITGFGRTGNDFGATTFGIEPDLMSVAKAMSAAYLPISGAIVRGDMYEAMVEPSAEVGMFGHGYTYSGHPVSCAVALKTLEIYRRDRLFERAAEMGDYFMKRLREFTDHPLVGEVRGRGLIAALELVADKDTRKAFEGGEVGQYCQRACQDNGLIVRAVAGSSIALCPPLIITAGQVDELVDKLGRGLDATLEYVNEENLLGA